MEMRDILNKLNESIMYGELNEDYDSRVQQVVNYINSIFTDGVTKEDFPKAIQMAGKLNILELKPISGGSGTTRKEFMRDVWKGVKKFKNPNANTVKAEERAKKLLKISQYIEDAVSSTFPDGDPFDHLMPKLRQLGLNDNNMMEWLDAATKKHLGMNGYYKYLAAVWDDFARDSGDILGIKPEDNPWK